MITLMWSLLAIGLLPFLLLAALSFYAAWIFPVRANTTNHPDGTTNIIVGKSISINGRTLTRQRMPSVLLFLGAALILAGAYWLTTQSLPDIEAAVAPPTLPTPAITMNFGSVSVHVVEISFLSYYTPLKAQLLGAFLLIVGTFATFEKRIRPN